MVLIKETFTRAEQILIQRGEAAEVQIIRRRFQLAIAAQLRSIVQSATGRCVRAFLSDTDLHEQLAVETFVLGEPVEDMAGFESEVARIDSEQAMSEQSQREEGFEPPTSKRRKLRDRPRRPDPDVLRRNHGRL